MTHEELMKKCGGGARVARHLGISRAAVCLWKGDVPDKHITAVAELAGVHPSVLNPDVEWVNVDGRYFSRPREAA